MSKKSGVGTIKGVGEKTDILPTTTFPTYVQIA